MEQKTTYTGVLLAGGNSVRFGSPKAFALFQEKAFYEYSLEALQTVSDDTIIVSQEGLKNFFPSTVHVTTDLPPYESCGPLAGIRTAMTLFNSTWFITAPCDTPLVTEEVLNMLKQQGTADIDAIIPIVHERKQPLIAMYHARCLPFINLLLSENKYKVNYLLQNCRTKYIDLSSHYKAFTNINHKEKLQILLEDKDE